MSQDPKRSLQYSSRSHRIASRIADKTANPGFSRIARATWMVAYRNAFEALHEEGLTLTWRSTAVIGAVLFGLGMLLRGAL